MFRRTKQKLVFDSKNVEIDTNPREDELDIENVQPVSSDVIMINPYSSPQSKPPQEESPVRPAPSTPPLVPSPPRSRSPERTTIHESSSAPPFTDSESENDKGLDRNMESPNQKPIPFEFKPIASSHEHERKGMNSDEITEQEAPSLPETSKVSTGWSKLLGLTTNRPNDRVSGIYVDKLATPGSGIIPTFSLPDNINSTEMNNRTLYGIDNHGYQTNNDEDEEETSLSSTDDSIDRHSIDSDNGDNLPPETTPNQGGVTFSNTAFENERGKLNHKQSIKKSNFWDVFQSKSEDNISDSELQCWKKCFVISRIVTLIILFFVVLIFASISKVSFLLMTSNIFPPSNVGNSTQKIKTFFGNLHYDLQDTEVTWIWALNITISAPYLFTFFKFIWRACFKKSRPLQCLPLFFALFTETLHSIGLSVFVFLVLPSFDPIAASLISFNVGLFPAIFKICYPARIKKYVQNSKLVWARLISIVAFVLQIGSLALWCYYIMKHNDDHNPWVLVILTIVSPILISINWWDNFVHKGSRDSKGLPKLKRIFGHGKSKIGIVVSLWKMIMTMVVMPSAIFGSTCENGTACVKAIFFQNDNGPIINSPIGPSHLLDNRLFAECVSYLPFMVAILNIFCNVVVFKTSKTACKIVAHKIGYAFPIALATPVSIGFLLGFFSQTSSISTNGCTLQYPTWVGDMSAFIIKDEIEYYYIVIVAGVIGYFSLHLITNHVWSPGKERLASTDKLFVKPLYCSALMDQSMFLNRRRCDEEFAATEEKIKKTVLQSNVPDIPDNPDWNPSEDWSILRKDDTPMIYMCATMWHETENEMTQILKSIFRMDEDQCTRRNMQLFLGIKDPDYYEFEAHIFFDDAFEKHTEEVYEYNVNGYVKMLINIIDLAASSVHHSAMKIPPPIKIPTPYGGRLIWRLPGGNKIVAHLKDKAKIRHRKRWSQVMYMYYFLGHRLTNLKCSRKRKEKISQNTFLLALDGDVDFQPIAVQLLVDRMRKNLNVGAACGRIHPIGSGPMVWYQKFEYAISHWLQKATENMLGCVLCSPGCFSLFRGSSLMDDNVMHRYTANPTEALHYVQYDQGEDRWLCTLLLQQGYKVEYVAASDALTYAPEGFYEFYNQRRRWSPSTMANIMDLLMDWKNVTRKNEDISMLYIGYQTFLMVSSILTPGTIFLMILGAITTGFNDIPAWGAFIINVIPVAIMVILCFTAKSETQLAYSAILSAIYTLLMMIVLIGLLKEAAGAKFCSVTTIFLLFVAGVFVISAILHPQEFTCVLHGVLYFLAIPSMSMLLMIYSLGNLHVVSWGTRETKQPTPTPGQRQTAKGGTGSKVKDWLQNLGGNIPTESSDYDYACGGLFRCICFPQSRRESEDNQFRIILERLDEMEQKMTEYSRVSTQHDMSIILDEQNAQDEEKQHFSENAGLFEGAGERNNPLYVEPKQEKRDELRNPYWVLDEDLKDGPKDFLPEDEREFWQPFIDKYLYPLESNKKKEEAIQNELLELRNKVCLGFILINALFVTILFVLTVVDAGNKSLSVTLPCNNPNNPGGKGFVEPISFAFTVIFGVLLLLQFIFMILHRIATLIHILASTDVKAKKQFTFSRLLGNDDGNESIGVDEGLQLVRDMQAANDDDTRSVMSEASTISDDDDDRNATMNPRKGAHLWKKLAKRRIDMQHDTLSKTFIKNFGKLQEIVKSEDTASTMATTEGSNLDRSFKDGKMSIAQNKFKRFARPSLHTIVKLAQNESTKAEIQRRGSQIKRNAENKKRFQNLAFKALEKNRLLDGKNKFSSAAKLLVMKNKEEEEEKTKVKTIIEVDEEVDNDCDKVKATLHSVPSDSDTPDNKDIYEEDNLSVTSEKNHLSSLDNSDILF